MEMIPERSEGLLFHRAVHFHHWWLTDWLTDGIFLIKEGKTARYSGHCHRNPPLGLCLVIKSWPKSDGINREIDLKKVSFMILGHTEGEISYIDWVSLVRFETTNPSCGRARPRGAKSSKILPEYNNYTLISIQNICDITREDKSFDLRIRNPVGE